MLLAYIIGVAMIGLILLARSGRWLAVAAGVLNVALPVGVLLLIVGYSQGISDGDRRALIFLGPLAFTFFYVLLSMVLLIQADARLSEIELWRRGDFIDRTTARALRSRQRRDRKYGGIAGVLSLALLGGGFLFGDPLAERGMQSFEIALFWSGSGTLIWGLSTGLLSGVLDIPLLDSDDP